MTTIDKQDLKNCLLKEGYIEENGLNSTISHLLNLMEEPTRMLYDWMKTGKRPEFSEIHGISSEMLRQNAGMKEPAIIIAYDMLLTNPRRNSKLLQNMLTKKIKKLQ
jgi:hypothetical protein